ncbi:unnamed protein product [Vicia faba]|uniref:Uncharacterized protein n=1 Tax=Vicia faba TaxID=3906 RepID=A0AAV1ALY1_VICFA|nr:unnamed protein product [Vicia faba]
MYREEWRDIIEDGASEADLSILPKYRFRLLNNEEKASGGAILMVPTETPSGYLASEQIPENAIWFPKTQFISVSDIYSLSLLRKCFLRTENSGSVATGDDQTVTKRRKVVEDDDNDNDKETNRNKMIEENSILFKFHYTTL